jgi:hypothetical protein
MGLSIIYFLASPCQLYVSFTPPADRVPLGLDRSIGANGSKHGATNVEETEKS